MSNEPAGDRADLSESGWRKRLSDAEYRILREAGTERPGSSELLHVDRAGVFRCAGCGRVLYRTDETFDSGTGCPNFCAPVDAAPGILPSRPRHCGDGIRPSGTPARSIGGELRAL